MKIKCADIKRNKEEIMKELEKITCMEKRFPEGELICTKNNERYKWLVKEQKRTSYLSKKKREFAEELAIKKYYEYKKRELQSGLFACEAYLKKIKTEEGKAEQLLYHPEYGKLLEKYFLPLDKELMNWQNAEYERCNKHEENLKQSAKNSPNL